MSTGHFTQPDKVFPAQPGPGGSSPAHTLSGKSRFTVHYMGTVGSKATTAMSIRQGAAETDGAFAARLAELSSVVQAMNTTKDATAHAALEVRRAELADQ